MTNRRRDRRKYRAEKRVRDRKNREHNERGGPIIQGQEAGNAQHELLMKDIRKRWKVYT